MISKHGARGWQIDVLTSENAAESPKFQTGSRDE